MQYRKLSASQKALIDSHGGEAGVFVRANLVRALNGNGNAAIMLSHFLWWARNQADEEGWFYRTQKAIEARTGLGEKAQKSARNLFQNLGLLEEDRRGLPARLYYQLDLEKVCDLLTEQAEKDAKKTSNSGPSQPSRSSQKRPSGASNQESAHGQKQDSPPCPPNKKAPHEQNLSYKGFNKGDKRGGERARVRHIHEGRSASSTSSEEKNRTQEERAAAAVQLHAEFYPNVRLNFYQKDLIRHKAQDLDLWRSTLRYWKGNDYLGKSVQRMLERYEEQESASGDFDMAAYNGRKTKQAAGFDMDEYNSRKSA